MKILARILALFLIMPVVELFLLVQLEKYADRFTGGWGLLFTLVVIFITGVVGSYLAKREGLSVWNRLKQQLDSGGLPGKELLDGVIILIAGALLITPGVLTDVFGFIGLIPPTRALVRKLVMRRVKKAMRDGTIQTSFGSAWGPGGNPGFEDAAYEKAMYEDAAYEDAAYKDATYEDISDAKRRAPRNGTEHAQTNARLSRASEQPPSERHGEDEPAGAERADDALRESEQVGQPRSRGEQRNAVEDE